ncbi:hypothetical protein L2E82_02551 [Cichorium intybus]|uniref:Uncharacterized protein n=1 Tax=Cichorium intybus TaxID=13427 RepID=A0ACB9H2S6_CICIN|nr:hypothetical protein L2E82_02551 [Cichorium intybus]
MEYGWEASLYAVHGEKSWEIVERVYYLMVLIFGIFIFEINAQTSNHNRNQGRTRGLEREVPMAGATPCCSAATAHRSSLELLLVNSFTLLLPVSRVSHFHSTLSRFFDINAAAPKILSPKSKSKSEVLKSLLQKSIRCCSKSRFSILDSPNQQSSSKPEIAVDKHQQSSSKPCRKTRLPLIC